MNTQTNFSAEELEDLALELGASVRRPDGSVFNAAGRSGVYRLPKKEPAPQPEPTPQPTDRVADLLQAVMELLARPQATPEVKLPEIVIPQALPPQVVVQPPPPSNWEFDFIRNPDGSLKSIKARRT